MKPGRREALLLGTAGIAAAAAGFLVGPILLQRAEKDGAKDGAGGGGPKGNVALVSGKLVDLDGRSRSLSEWKGRILLCNFWATWCAPCREEIPLLMAARAKYASSGIEIVGIAIDNEDKVREYAASLSISYPLLIAEADGINMMRNLGNVSGGLPYTVIADRHGNVINRKLGAFHAGDLDTILAPLTKS